MLEVDLLRCLIHIIGRATVPTEEVRTVLGKGKNRVKAFNLFNGSNAIQEVSRRTKINQGNLSRAASHWVESGIAFWIGEGKAARLLHVYAIPGKKRRGAR